MRRLALVLLLTPTLAVANPGDAKSPADPPAGNLLEQRPPRQISVVDTTRDGDRTGDRACEPNARGQIECRAPVEPPRGPSSPIASR